MKIAMVAEPESPHTGRWNYARRYSFRGSLLGAGLAACMVALSWRALATGEPYPEVAFGAGQLMILLGLPAYFVVAPLAAGVTALYSDRAQSVWPEFVVITFVLLTLNWSFWGFVLGAARDWLSRPAT